MASPAEQRQPSTTQPKGVIGAVRVYAHGGRYAHTRTACSRVRKSSKKCSAKAGLPVFRRGAAAPGHRYRVPPSFLLLLPLPRLSLARVESIRDSLALSRSRVRVVTLHATFSTQANSSGNRKFEIEASHRRSPSPPSFPLSPASPLISRAPGLGTGPGGASSNSGNGIISRIARSLSREPAILAFFPRFFFF